MSWKTAKTIGIALVGTGAALVGTRLFGRQGVAVILTAALGIGAHEMLDARVSKEIYKIAN